MSKLEWGNLYSFQLNSCELANRDENYFVVCFPGFVDCPNIFPKLRLMFSAIIWLDYFFTLCYFWGNTSIHSMHYHYRTFENGVSIVNEILLMSPSVYSKSSVWFWSFDFNTFTIEFKVDRNLGLIYLSAFQSRRILKSS